jgi:DNA-3-methyladenine glycosylase II
MSARPAAPPEARLRSASPPFRLDLALGYLGRSPLEPLDVVADGVYRRAVLLEAEPALLEVCDGDEPGELRLRLLAGSVGPEQTEAAAALVRRCFRLEESLDSLLDRASLDPPFGALVERLAGLRALIMPSPFEALIWAILGQQINVRFAYQLKRRLVETYGERLEHGDQNYYLFPRPERLAAADPAELRELQLSRQKSAYILGASQAAADGSLDLEALWQAPLEEARARLLALHGIGRWTAEYVLMRGLGARDELPAADIGLQVAAQRVYGLASRPSEAELRALAEPWTGWRSYYAFYLWYSIAPGCA